MNTYTPPVFSADDEQQYLQFLDTEGYVVVGNILGQAVSNSLIEKFWMDWTAVSPTFDRNDKSTWSIATSPMMFAKGMAVFSGLAHGDFMWDLRLQPQIQEIFAAVHRVDCTDMVVSFDGFSVFFDKKQKNPKPWWHVDQHPSNATYCVQGAYNFFPVTETSAGFTVVPRSHKHNVAIPKSNKGQDWIPVENDPILQNGVKLLIPKNCLVLWNSRTIHANVGMSAQVTEKRFDRLTCYITYMPRSLRSQATLNKKTQAYLNSDATSHWANQCEVKKYPWGFGPQYENKGFNRLKPAVVIPDERRILF